MKTSINPNIMIHRILSTSALFLFAAVPASAALKVHGIFGSHMVIQRDKPVKVWGWAEAGKGVAVEFGDETAAAEACDEGRWEVVFPAREASGAGVSLSVVSDGESVVFEDILIGDVWVMNGQSNMAWPLSRTSEFDMEAVQADLPLLRRVGIRENESEHIETDLTDDKIEPWTVATPQTVGNFGSIGYSFASRVQRALGIPVGIIDNARGGASLESLVPRHKFAEDPLAAAYLASVAKRMEEFDWDAEVAKLVESWEEDIAERRERGDAGDQLPPRPTRDSIRSWNIPGRSPSDAASCYNGMFGVFKGLNIKGVLFHQGYNNAMATNCRPRLYRTLMRLMIEGWREDFSDPELAVGVIGFCAGGIPQIPDTFELWSVAPSAYIREAQRLGLADVGDPENTAFLPAYDVRIPGLHPSKKMEHGVRAARWALNRIYDHGVGRNPVAWDQAELVSAEREGDRMVLTFDKPVMPDDRSLEIEGFAIAGESGEFYMAHAAFPINRDQGVWTTSNNADATRIHVWSPLVDEPVAVRYAWATSPMGNLKVHGHEALPLHSFRTDDWDWPESDNPEVQAVGRNEHRAMQREAEERLNHRRRTEAAMAVEILERLETLHEAP